MSGRQRVGTGTAFFPAVDVAANGPGSGKPGSPDTGRLRRLPRRRRPGMIALAVAMAGAGVIVSAALYQRIDREIPVVMVTAPVPAGSAITANDLTSTSVTVGAGIKVIPASEIDQLSGEFAAVPLRPGTLLAPSQLTSMQPPGPGQQLVPAAVKPSDLPASGLSPGDHVLIVATPGDQGQPGSPDGPQPLTGPVPAVVAAVNDVPDQDGLDVVDLVVSQASGPPVAEQVSTGQFALVVTRRSS
jgi:SAF domain